MNSPKQTSPKIVIELVPSLADPQCNIGTEWGALGAVSCQEIRHAGVRPCSELFRMPETSSNAGRTGMLKEDRHVTGDEARGRRAIKGSGMGNKPESNRRQVRSEGGHAWNL